MKTPKERKQTKETTYRKNEKKININLNLNVM